MYVCDVCQKSSADAKGWKLVQIITLGLTDLPTPGTPMQEEVLPYLYFDTEAHRNQWLTAAGLK